MTSVNFNKKDITEKDYNFIISNYVLSQKGEFKIDEIKLKLKDLILLEQKEYNFITTDMKSPNKYLSLKEIELLLINKLKTDEEKLDKFIDISIERLIDDDFISKGITGYTVNNLRI